MKLLSILTTLRQVLVLSIFLLSGVTFISFDANPIEFDIVESDDFTWVSLIVAFCVQSNGDGVLM